MPFEVYLEGIKKDPAKESEKLKVLIGIYKMYLEYSQSEGLSHFWDNAQKFVRTEYLTKDETDKKIAEVLGIGIQTLRKKARFKENRGRPKKEDSL